MQDTWVLCALKGNSWHSKVSSSPGSFIFFTTVQGLSFTVGFGLGDEGSMNPSFTLPKVTVLIVIFDGGQVHQGGVPWV